MANYFITDNHGIKNQKVQHKGHTWFSWPVPQSVNTSGFVHQESVCSPVKIFSCGLCLLRLFCICYWHFLISFNQVGIVQWNAFWYSWQFYWPKLWFLRLGAVIECISVELAL
jgi:hypothetical protein